MKPNCYECMHRRNISGDAHSSCDAGAPTFVTGSEHGKKKGWFHWPYNFDPVWLISCSSFKKKLEVVK